MWPPLFLELRNQAYDCSQLVSPKENNTILGIGFLLLFILATLVFALWGFCLRWRIWYLKPWDLRLKGSNADQCIRKLNISAKIIIKIIKLKIILPQNTSQNVSHFYEYSWIFIPPFTELSTKMPWATVVSSQSKSCMLFEWGHVPFEFWQNDCKPQFVTIFNKQLVNLLSPNKDTVSPPPISLGGGQLLDA